MKNFTDNQLNTMMEALSDHARRQRETAEQIEAKGTPEGLGDLATFLRDGEREAQALRAEFAGEYHRRGRTACDLAHPGATCPNA